MKVSVIIPCYNQGNFLLEALESLDHCNSDFFEVVIVNDGSTENETNTIISSLDQRKYRVIERKNGGLSAARNTGIENAKGEYVLLLDADNKIRPEFITEGKAAFEKDPDAIVVYGNGEYFGDLTGTRVQGPFNLQKQMLVNYIDACAMVRKSAFSKYGLYDEKMREGWEDWELWLRFAFGGAKFIYIDKTLFDYRVRRNSMSKSVFDNKAKTNRLENYVYSKYPDKMGMKYVADFFIDRFKRNPLGFIFKLFIRAYFPNYYFNLLKKDKIRNGF